MIDQKKGPSGRAGILIAFEGIDGTGKSTQVRFLEKELTGRGYSVVATREPTNGKFGRQIRELFVSRATVSPEEEMALFLADRREHVEEVIGPALATGKIVLTDRYYLSTAAYQGAEGLDPDAICRANAAFAPEPDLAILLVVPPAVGVHRIRALRRESLNAFEQEDGLARVAAVFDTLTGPFIRRLDGTRSVGDVSRQVIQLVDELLAERGR